MIFGTKSNYMLKYQKAKAKLVEYDIPQKDYPKFPLDSNELSYPVIYIISRYAESIIEDDTPGQEEFAPYIVKASQYFDAAVGAKDRTPYDADFLLSGSAAYFLSNDFGSSKVLCATLFERAKDISTMGVSQIILRNLLGYLLLDRAFPMVSDTSGGEKLCRALSFYYISGDGLPKIQQSMREYREAIYRSNDSMEIYYVDILLAVITIALSKASWKLLPQYSKLEPKEWAEYLKSSKAPKMLWPAQQLIGEKDVLNGANAIVQLPTGVGKTKSIELIIRSSFTSNRTTTAIIVAPLRALCNEIASDLAAAFGESVLINQFSDILENDFFVDVTQKSTLLICTPEKFNYIIHHQMEFLDGIGLYIFDESHMFDDENRGTAYELLISEIRKHINVKKQIVLLSAVLSNAEQIRQWLFNENGVLASDPSIKTTPKSIGFTSQTRDIHYYSEDSEQEDFYVPRSIEIDSLKKLGKERKKRYFPELADAKDIAIYYANKLCRNGGAAIFANQARSVQTIIRRIIELDSRGYDLSGIRKCSNTLEMNRIAKLVADHYGYEHPYAKACLMGVAPHYSSLPNGVRLAVEYSFRKKDLHLVICTSTLAQGVNIPIKYLFMTSFMLNQNSMKVRNFQNLMGRTARSGMYTEGSVIVLDADGVAQSVDSAGASPKVAEFAVAFQRGGVPYNMVVDVRLVDVGTDDESVFALGEAPGQLHAQPVGFFRGDLARHERLPHMIGNHIILTPDPTGGGDVLALCQKELGVSGPAIAGKAGDEFAAVCLLWVCYIVDDVADGTAHCATFADVQRHDAGRSHDYEPPFKKGSRFGCL